MSTEVEQDFKILESLDWEQACESNWHNPEHGAILGIERPPARWILRSAYECGYSGTRLICDPCKERCKNIAAVRCTRCGNTHFIKRSTFLLESLAP